MNHPSTILLSPQEARVLGVLVEKQYTVPDTYPLSLLAVAAGCNQKTSRDPVMELPESTVLEALESLRSRAMVIESSGGRVMRYAENLRRVLGVPGEAVALLATLMLRGPQTAAELRARCERLHRFSDVSAVEGYLEQLAARDVQPFVKRLPVQAGSREHRWVHLLCGDVAIDHLAQMPSHSGSESGVPDAGLSADVARLSEQLAALQAQVAQLSDEIRTLREGFAKI